MGLKPRQPAASKWSLALEERIRVAIGPRADVAERRMFGGLCFMVAGHMTVGINGDKLMARVGAEAHPAALREPHVKPMDFTGRPLSGFVWVEPKGTSSQAAVNAWVERCIAFTRALPTR